MLDSLVENQNRTLRGNRTLILLRLLLATVSLAILLLQESLGPRSGASLPRLFTAGGQVTALAYSLDGTRLYSGGSDATIRVWDTTTGNEVLGSAGVMEGHGDNIRALALNSDGTCLASASEDRSVRLWDAQAGKWLRSLGDHTDSVTTVSWSPDGRWLLSAGGENPLRLWNAQDGKLVRAAGDSSKNLTFAAFLPGGEEAVTAGMDGVVRFWRVADLQPTSEQTAHLRSIQAAALSSDGRWLVTGGGILVLWDLAARKVARATEPYSGQVVALGFDAKGNVLVSAGSDYRLVKWSLAEPKDFKVFGEHRYHLLAVALSPDGKTVATGSGDRIVRLWDTAPGEVARELGSHRSTLRSALPVNARSGKQIEPVPLYLRPEGLVVVIVLVLTILYTWALKRKELAPKLAYLQIFVDVGLITALVFDTGGVDSPFVTLYLISISAAAFVLSWRGAILVAAMSATLLSLQILLYGVGYIPEAYSSMSNVSEMQLRKYRHLDMLDYVRLLLLPVCAYFLVAVLAGNLARRLAVAHLLHQEVLEGIGEGILVVDLERNVLYSNQEVHKLLLLSQVLNRRPLREVLGAALDEQARAALGAGTNIRLEISHRRADGTILPFAVRLIPVLETDGPPRGLIVVLDDITAEKKMEEFFKHKERIEAMGQISATIAHEIRNPLASIRGAVQEIARSVEIPEGKKILIEIVLSESDRLDQIITDFLRYARMRPPKLSALDIGQLLEEIRVLLISRPEARDVEVRLESPEDLKPLAADPEQLRQVFLNLGLNALQAMEGRPEKRLTLRVRQSSLHRAHGLDPKSVAGRVDRPGVSIEFSDSGAGIPEEVRKQIFEPFFTTKPSGTGLGLALVARIVQGHDGVVSVESAPHKGTSFHIWLPSDRNELAYTSGMHAAQGRSLV